MANHETVCPACGAALLVGVSQHLGGGMEENVSLSVASPVTEAVSVPALASEPEPEAPAEEVAEEATETPNPLEGV